MTGTFDVEQGRRIVRVGKSERGRLVNGCRPCSRCRIGLGSGMQGQGVKPGVIWCGHELLLEAGPVASPKKPCCMTGVSPVWLLRLGSPYYPWCCRLVQIIGWSGIVLSRTGLRQSGRRWFYVYRPITVARGLLPKNAPRVVTTTCCLTAHVRRARCFLGG